MTARAVMFQGTASGAGKTLIVAGLCRALVRRGLRVAPFKPQNISNNAAACGNGTEIGRAQALQAQAARVPAEPDFNPVLLKPSSGEPYQLIVHGRVRKAPASLPERTLLPEVMASFDRLSSRFDVVLVEGSGSPGEINLRARDIANMGFARAAGVPVCMIGNIDRGGVIASLVGTRVVLDPDDAAMVRGFIVNQLHGHGSLIAEGIQFIEARTGWPHVGTLPWLAVARALPAEDTVDLEQQVTTDSGGLVVAVPILSRVANFDDLDPLQAEPGVVVRFVSENEPVPRDAAVIILLGTKSTIEEMDYLRRQGWDQDIRAHVRHGGRVLGICGGLQLLGTSIIDTTGIDGTIGTVEGLGLLPVTTTMDTSKSVTPVEARCAITSTPIAGYEMHMGRTSGIDQARAMFVLDGRCEGARSADGRIEGTYIHGLFANDEFRRAWLHRAGAHTLSTERHQDRVEAALDQLADACETHLDVDRLLAWSGRG